jgi:hypothetical protein
VVLANDDRSVVDVLVFICNLGCFKWLIVY